MSTKKRVIVSLYNKNHKPKMISTESQTYPMNKNSIYTKNEIKLNITNNSPSFHDSHYHLLRNPLLNKSQSVTTMRKIKISNHSQSQRKLPRIIIEPPPFNVQPFGFKIQKLTPFQIFQQAQKEQKELLEKRKKTQCQSSSLVELLSDRGSQSGLTIKNFSKNKTARAKRIKIKSIHLRNNISKLAKIHIRSENNSPLKAHTNFSSIFSNDVIRKFFNKNET